MGHMASIPKTSDLAALSVSDRLELLDRIWDSLQSDVDAIPVPEWHREEVERELAEWASDGNPGRPAEEVFRELKSRI